MVNQVLQTVLDYVDTPKTDHAILINGPWGCGKTYFWKNVVEPRIREKDGRSPLYASFYGCENIKDIDVQLLLASRPEIRKEWIKKYSSVGVAAFKHFVKKFTSFELPSINPRWFVKTKKAILCFDDLERSNLPFEEVLGYINTFVEHEGAKVVILCHEKAIESKEDFEVYQKMKEKVVGHTLDFQQDHEAVLSALAEEYKTKHKEYYNFLIQNKRLILQLFENSKTNNLRALRRSITALSLIFKTIHEGRVDPEQLAEQLIYAVGTTAFELYGRPHEATPEKLKAIHTMTYMPFAGLSKGIFKGDEPAKKEYEDEFNERYFSQVGLGEMGVAVACLPICEYLITGYLDKKSLLDWAQDLVKTPDEKKERIGQLMHGLREMDDSEVVVKSSQVLKEVENGEFSTFNDYASLFRLFEWLAGNKLISFSKEQIVNKFKMGMDKAQKAGSLIPNPRIDYEIKHLIPEKWSTECQTFCDYLLIVNKRVIEAERQNRISELISRLQDDPDSFILALADDGKSGFNLKPIFHKLDAKKMAQQIVSLPNTSKNKLWMVLHERYLRYQTQPEYLEELPTLIYIRDSLKNHYDQSINGLSTVPLNSFNIQEIIKTLDQAIEGLEKLKHDKETK